jgi:hypothetical protein
MKSVNKLKERKQQHAGKSQNPMPKDKPRTYWPQEEDIQGRAGKVSPQRERKKKELNEEKRERDPILKGNSAPKPRKTLR